MKSSIYLYGQKKDWGLMDYDKAIARKIDLANIELRKELRKDYRVRDTIKVGDLLNAIKFNEVLLNE